MTKSVIYAEIKRLDQLRAADQTATSTALTAAEKATAAALTAAKEAVNKAEENQRRTNEGQNEFRGQLRDQAATLLPRSEYDVAHRELTSNLDRAFSEIGGLRSRLDVGSPVLASMISQSDVNRGRVLGSSQVWGYVAGGVGVGLTVLTILYQIQPFAR